MEQVVVFGGTTEGRRLAGQLAACGITVMLCVATPYGDELVSPHENCQVHVGRMDALEMADFLSTRNPSLVIDATHPHAREVSSNLSTACNRSNTRCIRLIRPKGNLGRARQVRSASEAAELLAAEGGTALVTTGSKELESFTHVPDFARRLYVRVLPEASALEKCRRLGFPSDRIIAMQGPFSRELNEALLRDFEVDWLVSKDSGSAGGLEEKLAAAEQVGCRVLLITREEEQGLSYEEMLDYLAEHLKCERIQEQQEHKEKKTPSSRFPLFLSLKGRQAVVIGGGTVAARRIHILLEFGAKITVVSPAVSPEVKKLAGCGMVQWKEKTYEKQDLQGAFLVIAATDERRVNRQVGKDAKEVSIPISVADSREESSFWFPAIVRSKGMTMGLVSDAGDHQLVRSTAARLRKGEI